jgi:GNAT superfamily N-acetyltransferase
MDAIRFRYDVPLAETMDFEAVYHQALQLDLPQKEKFRITPGAIFVWMYVDGKLAGESYGFPLAGGDGPLSGLAGLAESEKRSGFHCYSNTILPAFQGRGWGTVLKAHWLGLVVGAGFEAVYGHARPGRSQELNARFGAVFLESFPDWGGTGEEYKLYRLALK